MWYLYGRVSNTRVYSVMRIKMFNKIFSFSNLQILKRAGWLIENQKLILYYMLMVIRVCKYYNK